jgi:hypothetical protein
MLRTRRWRQNARFTSGRSPIRSVFTSPPAGLSTVVARYHLQLAEDVLCEEEQHEQAADDRASGAARLRASRAREQTDVAVGTRREARAPAPAARASSRSVNPDASAATASIRIATADTTHTPLQARPSAMWQATVEASDSHDERLGPRCSILGHPARGRPVRAAIAVGVSSRARRRLRG